MLESGAAAVAHLLGRADEDLVDRHVARARDDVGDRVGDVLRAQALEVEVRRIRSRISGRLWEESSVATAPGSITETRTKRSVTSWRSASENALTANFVAL